MKDIDEMDRSEFINEDDARALRALCAWSAVGIVLVVVALVWWFA